MASSSEELELSESLELDEELELEESEELELDALSSAEALVLLWDWASSTRS